MPDHMIYVTRTTFQGDEIPSSPITSLEVIRRRRGGEGVSREAIHRYHLYRMKRGVGGKGKMNKGMAGLFFIVHGIILST